MVTWTTTVPEACACLAIGGYAGFGRLIAFPLSTPPEIGALGGVGLLVVAAVRPQCQPWWAGHKSSSGSRTAAIGAAAFESLVPTTVVTPRLTGGMSLAFAEISLGTSSVRETSAISSLRTSTFCSTFCGLASCGFSGVALLWRHGHRRNQRGQLEILILQVSIDTSRYRQQRKPCRARRR